MLGKSGCRISYADLRHAEWTDKHKPTAMICDRRDLAWITAECGGGGIVFVSRYCVSSEGYCLHSVKESKVYIRIRPSDRTVAVPILLIQSLRRWNAVRLNWNRLWPGSELEERGEESWENMIEKSASGFHSRFFGNTSTLWFWQGVLRKLWMLGCCG